MADKTEEIIMFDAENIVEYRTNLEGWTGKDNLYHGKGKEGEKRARLANSTHKKCPNCSGIVEHRHSCQSCYNISDKDRFLSKEAIEWDGESMMCNYDSDEFFSDMDEVWDHCQSNDDDFTTIRLIHCEKKVKISEINIDEMNEEYCTNDGDLGVSHYHPEIAKKVDELNNLIENAKPVIWFPTNKRISFDSLKND